MEKRQERRSLRILEYYLPERRISENGSEGDELQYACGEGKRLGRF